MRASFGILGLVLTMAVIYYLYYSQFNRSESPIPPTQQVDLVGLRAELLSLAQAERYYLAANGRYATMEELRESGQVTGSRAERRGYTYDVTVEDARHFRITARPADPSRTDGPALSIDETMQISTGSS
jgi:Tfp pilus assembly protein PilE